MKLEFEKDSQELKDFYSKCKYVSSQDEESDGDGGYSSFFKILKHIETGKHYSVEMRCSSGTYSKDDFNCYRRNFDKNEPYVVEFTEVVPREYVSVRWESVGE